MPTASASQIISYKEVAVGTVNSNSEEAIILELALEVHRIMGWLNLSPLQAGDSIIIRQYVKVVEDGDYALYAEQIHSGVQNPPLLWITPKVSKYGLKTTIQKLTGEDRDIEYNFFKEN